MNLSDNFSEMYKFNPPCPGFSVGPKENPLCAGSFTGFIVHEGVTFGLSNAHVLNSSTEILGSGPYKHKDGETKFMITMPAARDHDETKLEILDKLMYVQTRMRRVEEQMAGNLISPKYYDTFVRTEFPREEFWEEARQSADQYKIEVGHVYSRGSIYDRGFGFKIFGREEKSFIAEELGPAFIQSATIYFESGPKSRPIQEDMPKADHIYFKPASRSLGWRACKCNGIMTTMKDKEGHVIDEYCFVGYGLGEPVSAKGDSGTPLLDADFRPTATLWGGSEDLAGFKDVTYATPLAVVLRDIERRMGWEKGSVTYC